MKMTLSDYLNNLNHHHQHTVVAAAAAAQPQQPLLSDHCGCPTLTKATNDEPPDRLAPGRGCGRPEDETAAAASVWLGLLRTHHDECCTSGSTATTSTATATTTATATATATTATTATTTTFATRRRTRSNSLALMMEFAAATEDEPSQPLSLLHDNYHNNNNNNNNSNAPLSYRSLWCLRHRSFSTSTLRLLLIGVALLVTLFDITEDALPGDSGDDLNTMLRELHWRSTTPTTTTTTTSTSTTRSNMIPTNRNAEQARQFVHEITSASMAHHHDRVSAELMAHAASSFWSRQDEPHPPVLLHPPAGMIRGAAAGRPQLVMAVRNPTPSLTFRRVSPLASSSSSSSSSTSTSTSTTTDASFALSSSWVLSFAAPLFWFQSIVVERGTTSSSSSSFHVTSVGWLAGAGATIMMVMLMMIMMIALIWHRRRRSPPSQRPTKR